MAPKKRPAGVKLEPQTPKRTRRAEKPVKASSESDSEEEPAEASSSKPAKASPKKPAKASSSQPAKAQTAQEPKKPGKADKLVAPDKAQWNDVHYQLKKLRKSGEKPEMVKAWDEAEGSLQKRQRYYHMFLLDPSCASKQVHKTSLERLTTENTNLKGWVSKWDVGKMQGADSALPNFEELCDAACEGLKSRPHEVKAWADKGIRQYYLVKAQMTAEKHANESLTEAKQSVDLEEDKFKLCEAALLPDAGPKQVLLGSKQKPVKALANQPAQEQTQESLQEAYSKLLEGLQKASKSLGKAVDNLLLLQLLCSSTRNRVQAACSMPSSKKATSWRRSMKPAKASGSRRCLPSR